jgi:hypothetical protein
MVAGGDVDQDTDVLQHLMRTQNVFPRLHPILTEDIAEAEFSVLHAMPEIKSEQLLWLHHPGTENDVKNVSMFVLADLHTKNGKTSLMAALKWLNLPERFTIPNCIDLKLPAQVFLLLFSAFTRVAFSHTSTIRKDGKEPIAQLIYALQSTSDGIRGGI